MVSSTVVDTSLVSVAEVNLVVVVVEVIRSRRVEVVVLKRVVSRLFKTDLTVCKLNSVVVTVNTRRALWLRVFTSVMTTDEMMDLVTVNTTVVVLVMIIVVVVVVLTSFSGVTVMTVVPKQVESTVSYSMTVVVRLPNGQHPGHSPHPPPPLSSVPVVIVGKVSVALRTVKKIVNRKNQNVLDIILGTLLGTGHKNNVSHCYSNGK